MKPLGAKSRRTLPVHMIPISNPDHRGLTIQGPVNRDQSANVSNSTAIRRRISDGKPDTSSPYGPRIRCLAANLNNTAKWKGPELSCVGKKNARSHVSLTPSFGHKLRLFDICENILSGVFASFGFAVDIHESCCVCIHPFSGTRLHQRYHKKILIPAALP